MIQKLHELLIENKLTISTAESCTGGLLAGRLTDLSGSSAYFIGSIVSYSNEAKVNLLNVSLDTLKNFGAVSEQTAREMLSGCYKKFKTDIVCATTGIAGPGGETPYKSVGTVFIGVKFRDKEIVEKFIFPGDRDSVRQQTVDKAIELVSGLGFRV